MSYHRTWYIALIAGYYFIICSLTSIYYLSQHFRHNPAMIPWSTQLLCLAAAISGALYLANPRFGHRCLIITTLFTLFAIGESDIHATRFHLTVLAMLLLPLILNRQTVYTAPRAL